MVFVSNNVISNEQVSGFQQNRLQIRPMTLLRNSEFYWQLNHAL